MVRTKLEGKSVTELKVNSKFLPQALLEKEDGHPISWVFIELPVMRSTAKPESLPGCLMKLQL